MKGKLSLMFEIGTYMEKVQRKKTGTWLVFLVGALCAVCMLLFSSGCAPSKQPASSTAEFVESASTSGAAQVSQSSEADRIRADGSYYELDEVVLYLDTYGELPANFITKSEARDLGWSGGSVQKYLDGAAIGGDVFGNREGVLPKKHKGTYRECDIDTDGASNRGAKRLIYTDDGNSSDGCAPYYYTEDHYETFTEVSVENGEVIFDD